MKENFDPTKIQIDLCEPVNINFRQDPFRFTSTDENKAVRFEMKRSAFPSIEASNILILVQVDAIAEDSDNNEIAFHSSTFRFGFLIEDLAELIEVNEDGQLAHMHQGLLLNVTSIAISTLRGLLKSLYANTIFANYILPVMTPKVIMSLKEIELNGVDKNNITTTE